MLRRFKSTGKRSESISKVTPYKPVTKANYTKRVVDGETHWDFKDGQPDVMSIVNVYDAVAGIGDSDPGTLRELSFFAHGWMGGPILVNSYDDHSV